MTIQNSYHPTHPWYYVLGGSVLSLKEIWLDIHNSDDHGYNRITIQKASGNNTKLRTLKDVHQERLKADISRYRQCALDLHRYRKNKTKNEPPLCEDVHVNTSLKVSHIYNEFANLKHINTLLSYQPDLFEWKDNTHG